MNDTFDVTEWIEQTFNRDEIEEILSLKELIVENTPDDVINSMYSGKDL
jgi:hypothetical protein